eukprot:scaffold13609_cov151-Amphora_coffeaeformis.AAC.1
MNTTPLRLNQLTAATKAPFFKSIPSSAGHLRDGSGEKRRRRGGHSPPIHAKDYYANDKDCSFLSSSCSSNTPPAVTKETSRKPSRDARTHNYNKEVQPPAAGGFSWRHPLSGYASRRRDMGKNVTFRTNRHYHLSGRDEADRRLFPTTTDRNTKHLSRHAPSPPPPPGRRVHAGEGYRRSRLPSGLHCRPMAPPPPRHADTSGASTQRPTMMRMSRIGRPSQPMPKSPGVPKWIVCNTTSTVAAVSQMTNLSEDDDNRIDASLPRLVCAVGRYAEPDDGPNASCSDLTESSVETLESYNIGSDYSPVTVGDDDYF